MIIYPDLVTVAIPKLQALLDPRDETYAQDVRVSNEVVAGVNRMVTLEHGGGGGVFDTIDGSFLRSNVYAADEGECSDLAALVRALMTARGASGMVDGDPIVFCDLNAGPNPVVNKTGKPQMYMLFQIRRRGAEL